MSYRLEPFSDVGLDEALLSLVIDEHERGSKPRLDWLWTYYRNPLRPVGVGGVGGSPRVGERWYAQAQEAGLPNRITGAGATENTLPKVRREVVVENDIAWRIQSMVDFVFGKPVRIVSTARSESRRTVIEQALDAVWERSGGIALLQDMGTLGHVFGHVDLLLRVDEDALAPDAPLDDALRALRVEIIEPRRGIPILSERDYRDIVAYVIRLRRDRNCVEPSGPFAGVRALIDRVRATPSPRRRSGEVVEIISPNAWHVYEDGALVWRQSRSFTEGALPIVHVQNISQPFAYHGLSEVEPLIPLQDELNTRLSDRANRVTLQSFKMYLAKGLDGLGNTPVGPGQVWYTDNPDASITAFGGDAGSPGEEAHIREVREGLDKVSGVPPLAGGVVQARIGNLSSANALRITLMGLLAKTMRKRIAYGAAITRMSGFILTALNSAGVLRTSPDERGVRLEWPDPLPEDVRERLEEARVKHDLGVPADRILAALGEGHDDAGLT